MGGGDFPIQGRSGHTVIVGGANADLDAGAGDAGVAVGGGVGELDDGRGVRDETDGVLGVVLGGDAVFRIEGEGEGGRGPVQGNGAGERELVGGEREIDGRGAEVVLAFRPVDDAGGG